MTQLELLKQKLANHCDMESTWFMQNLCENYEFDEDMFDEFMSIVDKLIIYYKDTLEVDRIVAGNLYMSQYTFLTIYYEVDKWFIKLNINEEDLFDKMEILTTKISDFFSTIY